MEYSLPKIWMGRIQKYWDKIMPSNYPVSSSEFALKFDTVEEKAAVEKLEDTLGTEESVIKELVPEGTVVSSYIGTYNVTGTPDEETLLSPEKVNSDNILALHYDIESDTWSKVEDAHVVDGYVWGTLESFCPIAIVEYRKDIHKENVDNNEDAVVCEGNIVKITQKDESTLLVSSESTGTVIELTVGSKNIPIVGGSYDGSVVESTNVSVVGVTCPKLYIIGGSYFYSDEEGFVPATNKNASVNVIDSTIDSIAGMKGAVRVDNFNYTLKNSTLKYIGAGNSYVAAKKKDVNKKDCSFASNAWVKNVKGTIDTTEIATNTFLGGNSGYLYVDSIDVTATNSTFNYFIMGGSNGFTKNCTVDMKNSSAKIYQTTNRGGVGAMDAEFTGCTIDKLFVGGDATDSGVDGTTESIKYEINSADNDTYTICLGTEAGKLLTTDDVKNIVKYVKASRSANVTVETDVANVLGDRYVVK